MQLMLAGVDWGLLGGVCPGLVIASSASFACPEAHRCWCCAAFLLLHRLYHPDSCPLDTLGFVDASGSFNARTDNMQSHVADDGCLHIVAGGAAAWHLGWGWTGWCIAPAFVSSLQLKLSHVKLTQCLIAPPLQTLIPLRRLLTSWTLPGRGCWRGWGCSGFGAAGGCWASGPLSSQSLAAHAQSCVRAWKELAASAIGFGA